MKIRFNQEKDIELKDGTTLIELLKELGLYKDGVAVAIDESIVKKADFENYVLKDGMNVDIFNMVSGG
ncbi:MAG: sulfur carrier protein ThiS [Aeromonadales bacterium]|nr:sulfur carrier protein ThiS [Aeromonadales bacterium]